MKFNSFGDSSSGRIKNELKTIRAFVWVAGRFGVTMVNFMMDKGSSNSIQAVGWSIITNESELRLLLRILRIKRHDLELAEMWDFC